jgi:hypothetical protein
MQKATRWFLVLVLAALPALGWADQGYQTRTNLPRDTNPANMTMKRPVPYVMADGNVVLAMPNDEWAVNYAGDKDWLEFWSDLRSARLGVRAAYKTPGWTARAAVRDYVAWLKGVGGGEFTNPREVFVAGRKAVMASGRDVFGNYYYEIYGVERQGLQYIVWMRTPYANRWNRDLNRDVAFIVSQVRPSEAAVKRMLIEKK